MEQGYTGQRVRVEGGQRRGMKRRGDVEDSDEEWRTCAVGEYRVGDGYVVAGRRVVRLAEVVTGRRRTRKMRTTESRPGDSSGRVSGIRGNRVLQAGETNPEGEKVHGRRTVGGAGMRRGGGRLYASMRKVG